MNGMWELWASFNTTLVLGSDPISLHDSEAEAIEAAEYLIDKSKLLTRLVVTDPNGVAVLSIPELQ